MPVRKEEAERAILGSILINKDIQQECVGAVREEDFYDTFNRRIFEAIRSVVQAGGIADLVTVSAKLGGDLSGTGRLSHLAGLVEDAPISSNWKEYVAIVKEAAALRKIEQEALQIYECAKEGSVPSGQVASAAFDAFTTISERISGRTESPLGELAAPEIEILIRQLDEPESLWGDRAIPTGIALVDEMLSGGCFPGEFVVVAARPSVGKTALALSIAKTASIGLNIPSIFFSLEMSAAALMRRLVHNIAEVDGQKLRYGRATDEEKRKVKEAIEVIRASPLVADEYLGNTASDVLNKARRALRKYSSDGQGIIVIDFLQLMYADHGRPADNRNNEVGAIARALKAVSKQLKVPVVCCAQLNRAMESRSDHRPRLSDLRDSGEIEQVADKVILMSRESEDNHDNLILDVAKHRNGPTGEVKVTFNGAVNTFTERG